MATSQNPGEWVIFAGLASQGPGGRSDGFSLRSSALALTVIAIFFSGLGDPESLGLKIQTPL